MVGKPRRRRKPVEEVKRPAETLGERLVRSSEEWSAETFVKAVEIIADFRRLGIIKTDDNEAAAEVRRLWAECVSFNQRVESLTSVGKFDGHLREEYRRRQIMDDVPKGGYPWS